MSYNVLVVEDDMKMNEILVDYLETDGYQVYSARDGIEALSLFDHETIQLVILDIMIPKLDGWSVCRRIRQKSDVLIIILSARSEEDDKLLGYELGADEYITKPFSPRVLLAAISALLKRSIIHSAPAESIIRHKEIAINKEAYSAVLSGKELSLTVKEYELLLKFMENPGKVYRRDVLINAIWGYDYLGDGRVVDTNIKTLRKKLGDCSHYIQTVIGIGYKFEGK
ncbi:response regulator transcription factor [Anaerocolumna sp. AGMB13025]|uniref:response regulator transcription factor n=1 Tax=Anaerocolumna sp. AGMB13025 TaxID=3039116 RepID=UPI00241F7AF2|nr:response regulator transcription factor [Anaerocolumna sp. AGMB13025]WFR55709.1 response regulator transcription factor [Anaerocolumna sp. AGMB13025]